MKKTVMSHTLLGRNETSSLFSVPRKVVFKTVVVDTRLGRASIIFVSLNREIAT